MFFGHDDGPAGGVTVTVTDTRASLALVSRAVREENAQIYTAPEVLETTKRYNENDGVSKRVHELASSALVAKVSSASQLAGPFEKKAGKNIPPSSSRDNKSIMTMKTMACQ